MQRNMPKAFIDPDKCQRCPKCPVKAIVIRA